MNNPDEQILKEYQWSAYLAAPESFKPKLEATLVTEIVESSNGGLNEEFLSWKKCSRMLNENTELRRKLLGAWKIGSFEEIRCSEYLQPIEVATSSEHCMTTRENCTYNIHSTNIYGSTITEVHGNLISHNADHDEKTKKWICEFDYAVVQKDLSATRAEGTGNWFVESPEFARWMKDDKERILWCPGMPGVGKSVISSLVVDYLERNGQLTTCVIYFNYKRQATQNPSHVYSSILRQILEQKPAESTAVRKLHKSYSSKKSSPSEDDIYKTLAEAFSSLGRVYVILDALDEYLANYRDNPTKTLLERLLALSPALKLMVTSRVLGGMESVFLELGSIRYEILGSDHDIRTCLRSGASRTLSFIDDHSEEVIEKIMDVSKGRILLAVLHLNSLSSFLSWGEVREALHCLADRVDMAYEQVMERIYQDDQRRRALAFKVLTLIAGARRNLQPEELQYALAVAPGRTSFQDYISPLDTITGVCAGLVVLDRQQYTVRFVHQTAQEFFGRESQRYLGHIERAMADICLLSLSPFTFDEITNCRIDTFQHWFIMYVSEHWYSHIREGEEALFPDSIAFQNRRLDIYRCLHFSSHYSVSHGANEEKSEKYGEWTPSLGFIGYPWNIMGEIPSSSWSDIHLAAACDLPYVLHMLMNHDTCLNVKTKDRISRTPLELAVDFGATRTTDILLKASRTQNVWEEVDRGALLIGASKNGMLTLVDTILIEEPQADVNAMDIWRKTALMWAAHGGHYEIVKRLLDRHDIQLNPRSKEFHFTPLLCAFGSRGPHREDIIISILDDPRFDITLSHHDFQYMEADVRLSTYMLVQTRYRTEFHTQAQLTPAGHAARGGRLDVLSNILDCYPEEVVFRDSCGRSVLSHAVIGGEKVVNYLLSSTFKIDINVADTDGNTPLMMALQCYNVALARTLLEHGANPNVHNNQGVTPLFIAITSTHIVRGDPLSLQWIRILLAFDVKVDQKDSQGKTPLALAASRGSRAIVQLLHENGASITTLDQDLRTPISHAIGTLFTIPSDITPALVSKRRWETIEYLLGNGANLHAAEKDDLTPFKRAELVGDGYVLKKLQNYISGTPGSEPEEFGVETDRARSSGLYLRGGIQIPVTSI